jgi:thioredoxin 1
MSGIVYVKTKEEFDKLNKSDKLLLVKFGASWCGPCKQIKPHLQKLSEEMKDIIVVDIDVDDAQDSDWDWASEVENLPTFRFIRNGVQLEEYNGSKIEKIQDIIRNLF